MAMTIKKTDILLMYDSDEKRLQNYSFSNIINHGESNAQ